MRSLTSLAALPAALLLLIHSCSALVANRAVSIPSFTVSELGSATDAAFPGIHRDGGGGGVLDNKNWIVFSDTLTFGKDIVSNSYAQSDQISPINLTDFGTNGTPDLAVPWAANETASNDFIWPSTSITSRRQSDNVGYAVYPFGTRCSINGCAKYNTLVNLTASDDGLKIERVIPQLFMEGEEPSFGTFATTYHNSEDSLYLISGDSKIAKVPYDSAGDKSKYTYWNGGMDFTGVSNYGNDSSKAAPMVDTKNQPISGSPCGFSTGDVFWSNPINSWVIIYMTSCADSTFYIRYSMSGAMEGPYSDQQLLYKTTPVGEGYSGMNYAGHAYPQFLGDRTGKEVLLSWTSQPKEGYEMGMARVTFL